MPGKSKKGGGLKTKSSPFYKMKGHTLPGPRQSKKSPLTFPPLVAALPAIMTAAALAIVGAVGQGIGQGKQRKAAAKAAAAQKDKQATEGLTSMQIGTKAQI